MSFLKRIAQSLMGGAGEPSDTGIYLYVKLDRSGEIVKLRLNPSYELSVLENGQRFTRKYIIGSRSFEKAEAAFYFDKGYKLLNAEISGGELSDQAAYLEQQSPPDSE